jgi:hypothetical protein
MSSYRTIGEVEEQYLRDHPEEVDDYIAVLFDDYAESGDTASLMASLRVLSRVKGVSLAGLMLLEEHETKLSALRQALKDGEESGLADYSLEGLMYELDSESAHG